MKPDAEKDYVTAPVPLARRNRFDRWEWAGACGDLGTLIPFVAGYIAVTHMDPFGVLFAFGLAMVLAGLYYATPFPVQPMFPLPILGVILFLAGGQLARGAARMGKDHEPIVLITTAAFALWNVGVAFIVGIALDHALRRGWGKP